MPEYFLFAIYAAVIFYLIKKWNFFSDAAGFPMLAAVFIVKVLCGAVIAYIYSDYYKSGDTFLYMNDARSVYDVMKKSPLIYLQFLTGIEFEKGALEPLYSQLSFYQAKSYIKILNDQLFFTRINSLLCIFSFGYYYVQLLLMCFISMIGITALYKSALLNSLCNKPLLFIACYCIPTVLSWGSVVLKEPFILFFIGMLIFFFNNWIINRKKSNLAWAILAFILLLNLRPFIPLIIAPGLIGWWISYRKKYFSPLVFFICYLFSYILAAIIGMADVRLSIFHLLNDQQIIYLKNAVFHPAKSLIGLIPFAPNPVSVLIRSPQALLVSLSRPFISECKNNLQLLAAFENYFIIILLIVLLFSIDYKKRNLQTLAIFSVISGIIILIAVAYTTPVLGTLVRLKMPGVLLLVYGLASNTRQHVFKWH